VEDDVQAGRAEKDDGYFADVVTLNVDIQVEHTRKPSDGEKGLDDTQTSKALIAADTAKANKEGKVSIKRAEADAQALFRRAARPKRQHPSRALNCA